MRFKTVYDKNGRLRVRCGDYAFTKEQCFGIEKRLSALPYIKSVQVNRASGGILVNYAGEHKDEILGFIAELDKKNLPVAPVPASIEADEKFKSRLYKKVGKKLLMKLIPTPCRRIMIIIRAARYILKGLDSLLRCDVNVSLLDAATIGICVFRKNYSTAASVMFLLGLSELLEEYTRQRTKLALTEQLALNVDTVWLKTDNEPVQISFSEVKIGDKIIVNAGNVIPFDGMASDSEAMVNQATMTGESEPVLKKYGSSVFAGTTVEAGSLTVEVKSLSDNSRLQKIIDMIDESENLKAGIQSKAERLADRIVPYSFLGFAAVFALTGDIRKALSVLMVDFSCAIKLSTPISVISAMREAAEYGVTVKGGKYLEAMANADTIVFDKTGTLTTACPKVIDVIPFNGYERDFVLKTAACLEEHFPHSVAAAVVSKAKSESLLHEEEHTEVEYLVAHGIVTSYGGKRAIIGSAHFVFEDENIPVTENDIKIINEKSKGNSSVFLAVGNTLAGMLVIDDPVRSEAAGIIKRLRSMGFEKVCMLTGDSESAACRVADSLKLDEYMSQVLPEHKSDFVKALQKSGHKVVMVGDGVNDTPALAAADVSVAMSDGSDIAREVADISLKNDSLEQLVTIRQISESLIKRIRENYRFIVGFNGGLILLVTFGIIPATALALLHNSSTMLISAKSMTRLTKK